MYMDQTEKSLGQVRSGDEFVNKPLVDRSFNVYCECWGSTNLVEIVGEVMMRLHVVLTYLKWIR